MAAPLGPSSSGELLTQLQDQINALCTMFFDFVGTLQRDAPPASLAGEPLVAAGGSAGAGTEASSSGRLDVAAASTVMSAELLKGFKHAEALIQAIPQEVGLSEEEHYGRIQRLQQQHAVVSGQLAEAVTAAEAQLLHLQRLYAVLARQKLQDGTRSQLSSGDGGLAGGTAGLSLATGKLPSSLQAAPRIS